MAEFDHRVSPAEQPRTRAHVRSMSQRPQLPGQRSVSGLPPRFGPAQAFPAALSATRIRAAESGQVIRRMLLIDGKIYRSKKELAGDQAAWEKYQESKSKYKEDDLE